MPRLHSRHTRSEPYEHRIPTPAQGTLLITVLITSSLLSERVSQKTRQKTVDNSSSLYSPLSVSYWEHLIPKRVLIPKSLKVPSELGMVMDI